MNVDIPAAEDYAASCLDAEIYRVFAADVLAFALEAGDDHLEFVYRVCRRAIQLTTWRETTLAGLYSTIQLLAADCGTRQ